MLTADPQVKQERIEVKEEERATKDIERVPSALLFKRVESNVFIDVQKKLSEISSKIISK